jgi:hypothetical protein
MSGSTPVRLCKPSEAPGAPRASRAPRAPRAPRTAAPVHGVVPNQLSFDNCDVPGMDGRCAIMCPSDLRGPLAEE